LGSTSAAATPHTTLIATLTNATYKLLPSADQIASLPIIALYQ
jgi:hypothetical protein